MNIVCSFSTDAKGHDAFVTFKEQLNSNKCIEVVLPIDDNHKLMMLASPLSGVCYIGLYSEFSKYFVNEEMPGDIMQMYLDTLWSLYNKAVQDNSYKASTDNIELWIVYADGIGYERDVFPDKYTSKQKDGITYSVTTKNPCHQH